MRGFFALRKVRTVLAVDRGEQRILALRLAPPLLDRRDGQAHPVGRLMARDAGTAVRSDRLEERMPARVYRPCSVDDAERPIRRLVLLVCGKRSTAAGIPLSVRRIVWIVRCVVPLARRSLRRSTELSMHGKRDGAGADADPGEPQAASIPPRRSPLHRLLPLSRPTRLQACLDNILFVSQTHVNGARATSMDSSSPRNADRQGNVTIDCGRIAGMRASARAARRSGRG